MGWGRVDQDEMPREPLDPRDVDVSPGLVHPADVDPAPLAGRSWEIRTPSGVVKFEAPDPESGNVYHLEVDENARRSGLGTALLAAAERELAATESGDDAGEYLIGVSVQAPHDGVPEFFAEHGYEGGVSESRRYPNPLYEGWVRIDLSELGTHHVTNS